MYHVVIWNCKLRVCQMWFFPPDPDPDSLTDIKAHRLIRWAANSHARRRQQWYNLTYEKNSSVLIHQHQSSMVQSSFAANNQTDQSASTIYLKDAPVVVKTYSGRIVVQPVGTVNRTKAINRPFNDKSTTSVWLTFWDCLRCRLYRTKMFCWRTPLIWLKSIGKSCFCWRSGGPNR